MMSHIPNPTASLSLLKDFVALSAVAVFVSSLLAYLYIICYLSYFNANLIWLVEYSDLTKIIFLQIFLLLSSIISAWFVSTRSQSVWLYVAIFGVPVFAAAALLYFGSHSAGDTRIAVLAIGYSLFALGLTLIVLAVYRRDGYKFDAKFIGFASLSIVLIPMVSGLVIARAVDSDESNILDVDVDKDKYSRTLHGAKMIIAFSHHMIFQIGPKIVVLPTTDVSELKLIHIKFSGSP